MAGIQGLTLGRGTPFREEMIPALQNGERPRVDGLDATPRAALRTKQRRIARGQERQARAEARKVAKAANKGFKRYQAVRDQVWRQAVERNRLGLQPPVSAQPVVTPAQGRPAGNPPDPRDYSYDFLPYPTNPAHVDPTRSVHGTHSYEALSRSHHYPSQSSYAQPGLSFGDHRPMVEPPPPPVAYDRPYGERVSYRAADLKDYLVESIEPRSPENPYPLRKPGDQGYRPSPVPHVSEFRGSNESLAGRDRAVLDQGFIQLPPRETRERLRPIRDDLGGASQGYPAATRSHGPALIAEPSRFPQDGRS